jgi:hypothetical protein
MARDSVLECGCPLPLSRSVALTVQGRQSPGLVRLTEDEEEKEDEEDCLVRQCVDRDIQRQLLAVFRADAFAVITCVVRAERAAKAVFAHDRDEIALVEQAFELDVARLVETTDVVDLVKRAVDQVIVRDGFNFFIREDAAEFTPPRPWEFGIRAAARGEEETAVTEIFPQILKLGFREGELIVTVHEQERCFIQVRVGQANLAFLLNLERGSAGDEFHQIFADVAAIIAVVLAVFDPAHEERGLFVVEGLGGTGLGKRNNQETEQ